MRQLAGGPIKICSRRIGGKAFITVVGYQVGGKNAKVDLRKLAAHTLAEVLLSCDELVRPHQGPRRPAQRCPPQPRVRPTGRHERILCHRRLISASPDTSCTRIL